jgi:adenine/guanine phosphoribosyltransferase-like PRPP-binding protein
LWLRTYPGTLRGARIAAPFLPTVRDANVTAYWQGFGGTATVQPYQHDFPARMPDGRFLQLRLRPLDGGATAVADLVITHASFLVLDALADWLARALRPHRPEVLLGLPALGHVLAAETARRLSLPSWVPFGSVADRWQDFGADSPAPARFAPEAGLARTLRLDPLGLPRLRDRRVVLVDDLLRKGHKFRRGLQLLDAAGIRPVAVAAAMTQGDAWRQVLPAKTTVVAAFATPLLRQAVVGGKAGWVVREDSVAWDVCPLFRQGLAKPGAPRLVTADGEVTDPG